MSRGESGQLILVRQVAGRSAFAGTQEVLLADGDAGDEQGEAL